MPTRYRDARFDAPLSKPETERGWLVAPRSVQSGAFSSRTRDQSHRPAHRSNFVFPRCWSFLTRARATCSRSLHRRSVRQLQTSGGANPVEAILGSRDIFEIARGNR